MRKQAAPAQAEHGVGLLVGFCHRQFCGAVIKGGEQAGNQVVGQERGIAGNGGDQAHPVFALVRAAVRGSLEAFLAGGGRKIDAWYAALKVVEVPFDDEADAFRNINTREELAGA